MAREAANVSRLQLVMRIPKRNAFLKRTVYEALSVLDVCAVSVDEVLLACNDAGVRAVSLHTAQLVAHEPNAIRKVWRVAFVAHTNTLLLLVQSRPDFCCTDQLVSLRRNGSEWLEVQRLDIRVRDWLQLFNIAVCDSRVLLGGRGGDTLYVFDVSAESTLRDAGNVTLQSSVDDLACTRRDGVTLVAVSYDNSVSLLRLTSLPLRLEPLASVNLTKPYRLLFRGDLLLVNSWNHTTRSNACGAFRVSGNELTEWRVLLVYEVGVSVHYWALAGDRLVFWNDKSEELCVYAFT